MKMFLVCALVVQAKSIWRQWSTGVCQRQAVASPVEDSIRLRIGGALSLLCEVREWRWRGREGEREMGERE